VASADTEFHDQPETPLAWKAFTNKVGARTSQAYRMSPRCVWWAGFSRLYMLPRIKTFSQQSLNARPTEFGGHLKAQPKGGAPKESEPVLSVLGSDRVNQVSAHVGHLVTFTLMEHLQIPNIWILAVHRVERLWEVYGSSET
jgi:hypothetical protein